MDDFINNHMQHGRRIVLITSGGTTVPLERTNVRFIDNFSAGTRGSASAEYFLSQGYAVIFLSRTHSLQPYTRRFPSATAGAVGTLSLIDSLEVSPFDSRIQFSEAFSKELLPTLQQYALVKHDRLLFTLHFTTIAEYLSLLRSTAIKLQPYSSRVLFYLAAAVSDFVMPEDEIPEHKIQSGTAETLTLKLAKAPKVLKALIENEWAPRAFICSFKLETDEALLIPKARKALDNYGHQIVVANILAKRAHQVVLVSAREEEWITLNADPRERHLHQECAEIEEVLVEKICKMHGRWIMERSPAVTPKGARSLSPIAMTSRRAL